MNIDQTLQIATIVVDSLLLIGVVVAATQAYLARRSLDLSTIIHRENHDWNRRMAAQSALSSYNSSVILSSLHSEFSYIDRRDPISIAEMNAAFENNPDLKEDLHKLLNFYESLARGVHQKIYDEEVIKVGRKGAMVRAYRAFLPYIEQRRRANNSPTAWCELESIAARWLHEESQRPHRNPTDTHGLSI